MKAFYNDSVLHGHVVRLKQSLVTIPMCRLTTHNLRRYTANSLDYVSKRRDEPSDESGYFGIGKQRSLDANFLVANIKEAGRLFIKHLDAVRGFTPLIPVGCFAMNGENRPLVADKPVEFEDGPLEVQDFGKITHHLRGVFEIFVKLTKKYRKMWTCNQLDLETLGSRPILSKNLPGHRCFAFAEEEIGNYYIINLGPLHTQG